LLVFSAERTIGARGGGCMELSNVGLGTYLGAADDATDEAYTQAALAFFDCGGNVFDTAANYRGGRSEQALGRAFQGLPREALFVSTKAGYLPMGDGRRSESPRAWFRRVLEGPGVLSADEVVDGCHCLTPRYLAHQLGLSRESLGLERIDLFHLHNPEQQRTLLGPERFREVLLDGFRACEEFRSQGWIGAYGCATWNGFRVPPHAPDHLALEELVELAVKAGGKDHGFRWVQLPLNLAMPEAFLLPTQALSGIQMPFLEAAQALGIRVQTSASLMQARILGQLDPEVCGRLGGTTPALSALQFTRSCPGVDVALCGMASKAHVDENKALFNQPKAQEETLRALFCWIYFDSDENISVKGLISISIILELWNEIAMDPLIRHAARLAALGHPARLAILRHIVQGGEAGCPAGEIQRALGVPASTLSHHLSALAAADLVQVERQGTFLRYRADFATLLGLTEFIWEDCCGRDPRAPMHCGGWRKSALNLTCEGWFDHGRSI
jgi:aryl-alcohol dehydrogenase-like predicted oxidoreductase/DNA-binding transcriptional ArsR family regulator